MALSGIFKPQNKLLSPEFRGGPHFKSALGFGSNDGLLQQNSLAAWDTQMWHLDCPIHLIYKTKPNSKCYQYMSLMAEERTLSNFKMLNFIGEKKPF